MSTAKRRCPESEEKREQMVGETHPSILMLNVGGRMLTTLKSTLEAVPMIQNQLSSAIGLPHINGVLFLDRNPDAFTAMLNALRGHPLSDVEQRLAVAEADYWNAAIELAPSTVHIISPGGLPIRLHIPHCVWMLLPGLVEEVETEPMHTSDGVPIVPMTQGVFTALRKLQCAVLANVSMPARYWHLLRMRYHLSSKDIPLLQILPPMVDQYDTRYTLKAIRNQAGYYDLSFVVNEVNIDARLIADISRIPTVISQRYAGLCVMDQEDYSVKTLVWDGNIDPDLVQNCKELINV